MEKGKTYHELLTRYIQDIGCTDCPARRGEAASAQGMVREDKARAVGQVIERNGVWEIHLIIFDINCPYCMERRVLRTFRSKRLAEIVARYTADVRNEAGPESAGSLPNVCWN